MANEKITDLTDIGTPDNLDVLEIVDVSDTTDSPAGTSKSVKVSELKQNISGLMVKSNNLSDVTNVATARTNLEVYSTGEVDMALGLKQDTLTFDSTPTDGSNNPVTSNGVFDSLALKADILDLVNSKVLAADITTTSTMAVDTNLSHAIAANERLTFIVPLHVLTAAGGIKLQITVPAGAVVTGGGPVAQGGSTSLRFLNLVANTLSVAISTVALTSPMNLIFTVKNSTTAGNVIVSFASATGGSTTILENSSMITLKTTQV
jgi:hypothetical protein